MTQEEIDTLWQQAMQDSVKDGEMFTRYHFAKLVAAKKQEDIIKTIESFGTWANISEIVNEVRGQE